MTERLCEMRRKSDIKKYVWCHIFENGSKWPVGWAKDIDSAMSCKERKYPDSYKLHELKEVNMEGIINGLGRTKINFFLDNKDVLF